MITKELWRDEIDKSNLIECDIDTLIEIRDYFDYQWIWVYPGMQDDSDRAMFDENDNLIGYMENHGKSYIAPHILELPRPPKPEPEPGTALYYINKYLGEAFDNAFKQEAELDTVRWQIKHPHFQYATYDFDTKEIKFKIKPFWKWFSGKREVHVKIKKIKTKGLADYSHPTA